MDFLNGSLLDYVGQWVRGLAFLIVVLLILLSIEWNSLQLIGCIVSLLWQV